MSSIRPQTSDVIKMTSQQWSHKLDVTTLRNFRIFLRNSRILHRSDLEKIGLLNFYTDDHSSKPPFVFKRMFERLCDIFHQETFEKINGNRSKLRTYAIFKKEKGRLIHSYSCSWQPDKIEGKSFEPSRIWGNEIQEAHFKECYSKRFMFPNIFLPWESDSW